MFFSSLLRSLPAALVALRLAIAPLLLWDAWEGETSVWFSAVYIAAVLSDILDGIIARRLGVSTMRLRQSDSWADVCLYSCVALSVWRVYPQTLASLQAPLLLLLIAQLVLYGLSWLKFGKFPSYHTYTAKFWGVTLAIATVSLFGFGQARWNGTGSLWLAIGAGLVNSIEEIAITLTLPAWQHDVLSWFQAKQIANSQLKEAQQIEN